jgi:hypothetical protein
MTCTLAMRLLIGVALLVAALLLAPTGALAHAGHGHAAPPEVQRPEPVEPRQVIVERPDSAFEQTDTHIKDIGGVSLERHGQSYWTSITSSDKSQQLCRGGCCNAAGMSCCAVSLTDVAQVYGPSPGRSVFDTELPRGAGIKPGALPEPPKFFS